MRCYFSFTKVLAAACAAALRFADCSKINKENYEKLEIGMT